MRRMVGRGAESSDARAAPDAARISQVCTPSRSVAALLRAIVRSPGRSLRAGRTHLDLPGADAPRGLHRRREVGRDDVISSACGKASRRSHAARTRSAVKPSRMPCSSSGHVRRRWVFSRRQHGLQSRRRVDQRARDAGARRSPLEVAADVKSPFEQQDRPRQPSRATASASARPSAGRNRRQVREDVETRSMPWSAVALSTTATRW